MQLLQCYPGGWLQVCLISFNESFVTPRQLTHLAFGPWEQWDFLTSSSEYILDFVLLIPGSGDPPLLSFDEVSIYIDSLFEFPFANELCLASLPDGD